MLALQRAVVVCSPFPLWPKEGAWLGLRMHPPEVEARLQSGLRCRGSCVIAALWLLVLWSRGKGSAPALATGASQTAETAFLMILMPVLWVRFAVCRELVASRHRLYCFLLMAQSYVAYRSVANGMHDMCHDLIAMGIVMFRRAAVAVVLGILQVFFFWQVSVCFVLIMMMPGFLVYLRRCTDQLVGTLQTSTAISMHPDSTRVSVIIGTLLVILASYQLHKRSLSRELTKESLDQEHARFVSERQSVVCQSIVRASTWRMTVRGSAVPPEVFRDICGLRWLLVHQERSGTRVLRKSVEVLISEFLGHKLRLDLPHNNEDPFGLFHMSSLASETASDCSSKSNFRGIRLRRWMSQLQQRGFHLSSDVPQSMCAISEDEAEDEADER